MKHRIKYYMPGTSSDSRDASRSQGTISWQTTAALFLLVAAAAQAQGLPAHPPQIEPFLQRGHWSAPYCLDFDQGNLYGGTTSCDHTYYHPVDPHDPSGWTGEVAHAAVLPPTDFANPSIRVWLACANYCKGSSTDPLQVYGRSFIWNPNRSEIGYVDPPPPSTGFPSDGSVDWFCGGHTFLEDGRLLIVNGTDMVVSCGPGGFAGHDEAWILNAVAAQTPTWAKAPSLGKRWYPTAKLFGDGSVGVFGHTSAPDLGQTEFWMQWVPGPGNWTNHFNFPFITGCPTTTAHVKVFDYPRLQLLANGQLMWADSHDEPTANHASRYLDIQSLAWCPGETEHQWKDATTPSALRLDTGTAHFLVWNGDHPGTFKEVVYIIGGSTQGIAGGDCGQPTTTFLATAEKIVNPTATDLLSHWEAVPSLIESRTNANVVILLDGSILVVGGMATDGSGNCVSRFHSERYKTPEIFGPTTPDQWVQQNPQSVDRRYHAVAGLLADGKVFSAGGFMPPLLYTDLDGASDDELDAKARSAHTLEVFSPGYSIAGGRPDIDQSSFVPPGQVYQYGQTFVFDVQLATNATVARVAALRNGTSTHAYDPDQRYVELERFPDPVSLGNGLWRVSVKAPPNGRLAPPGYYMLTVTDNLQRPSPAEWVVFEP